MNKSVLILFFLCAFVVYVQAQDSVFYYDEFGGKIYLQKDNNVKYIHFVNEIAVQNHSLFNQMKVSNVSIDTLSPLMYKITGDFRQKALTNLLLTKQTDSNVLYISDMLLYNDFVLWESNRIIVKIFPNTELLDNIKIQTETNYIIQIITKI